jgi:hypothetical protein
MVIGEKAGWPNCYLWITLPNKETKYPILHVKEPGIKFA